MFLLFISDFYAVFVSFLDYDFWKLVYFSSSHRIK